MFLWQCLNVFISTCYLIEVAQKEARLRLSIACAGAEAGALGADDEPLKVRYPHTAEEDEERTPTDAGGAA